ncbi:hypothetical protein L9F63_021564 [Diploptera punctata]|uniref:EF-hand domain-containing protein n=1 Tax=Diploptera punctata TaxID=6984 RepID=A0AAD7ZP95_DIPPU|nr:hypothetical protein L9F63_021564 [Diploptera punctata]
MGSKSSRLLLEDEEVEEYVQLTYLKRTEILHLWDQFYSMDSDQVSRNKHCCLPVTYLEDFLPELKVNPFRDRLYDVFFLNRDQNGGVYFSFEEMLDMCSALSPKCPAKVKASWAFKVFDFNEDNAIDGQDLSLTLDRLTNKNQLSNNEKKEIIDTMMKEVNISKSGAISSREFVHVIMKMPDFSASFQMKA